jgi:chromosome segregation ATPase
MEENNKPQQDEELHTIQDESQEQPQKKSKEENFDGVVRKLNAKERELKTVNQQLQELQAKIEAQSTDITKSQEDLLVKMQAEIEALKNERQQESFQNKLDKGLEQANIESKFSKLAKTALQDIAQANNLNLNDQNELQEAIKLLITDYPEFIIKKQKTIGIANGQSASNNPTLSALEGNAEGYFNLSDAEKQALRSKVLKK